MINEYSTNKEPLDIQILVDVDDDQGGVVAYSSLGHHDPQEFINELLEYVSHYKDEVYPDEVIHKYRKWIPNPNSDEESDEFHVLDERMKPKEGYFPITIYNCD